MTASSVDLLGKLMLVRVSRDGGLDGGEFLKIFGDDTVKLQPDITFVSSAVLLMSSELITAHQSQSKMRWGEEEGGVMML